MPKGQRDLDAIIDLLYAGALDAAAWDCAMQSIVQFMNARGQLCVSLNPTTGQAYREQSLGYDPAAVADYHANWITRDPRFRPGLQLPPGMPLTEHDMLPVRKFKRSEVFNEFLVPNEVPWFMVTWLHQTPQRCTYFSIQGGIDRAPFDEDDRTRMLRLAPHIRRVLEIQDRLASADVRAATFSGALDHATFGALIFDSTGCILDASEGALATLQRTGVLFREPGGRFMLRDPAGGQLRELVDSSLRNGTLQDGSIQLRQAPGKAPLSLVILPAPRAMASWFRHDACWLGLLFDPDRRVEVSEETLRDSLGLSGREAQIVALLIGGTSLKDTARQLGVSFETARSQLKSIFLKTGVSSQSELVRKVMAGPAVRPRPTG